MQFTKLSTAFFIIGTLLSAWPTNALAEVKHYSKNELETAPIFFTNDNKIELSWQKGKYSYLDLYFDETLEPIPRNIVALSPVYYYYLYSEEVTNADEVLITYNIANNIQPKVAYYWSEHDKNYTAVPITAVNQQTISFSLPGKSNKFFIAQLGAFTTIDKNITLPGNFLTLKLPEILNEQKISTTIEPVNEINASKNIIGFAYNISFKPENGSPITELLNASKNSFVCADLLRSTMASNTKNKVTEVKKLQQFLKDNEGFLNIQINGKYDKITIEAIKDLQEKYSTDILKPWGLKEGTGQAQKNTLKKINALNCEIDQKNQSLMKIISNYAKPANLAKNWHYFDENTGSWTAIDSLNNHKQQNVIAYLEPRDIKVALFEEPSQWIGEASWYAWKNGLFAASRDFSKGTKIKVTNQTDSSNKGKSAIVTINDFGPEAWTKRIIDLDKIAYQQIGNLGGGVMPVKIEVVK